MIFITESFIIMTSMGPVENWLNDKFIVSKFLV